MKLFTLVIIWSNGDKKEYKFKREELKKILDATQSSEWRCLRLWFSNPEDITFQSLNLDHAREVYVKEGQDWYNENP